MLDGTILQASHEWEEEGEAKLLVLVEPPAGVEKDVKGQVLNDVSIAWEGGPL